MAFVTTAPGAAQDILVTNVTLLSPERSEVGQPTNVLIVDGRIAKIGQIESSDAAGTKTLDGHGKYLTPGLMDSHVHIAPVVGLPIKGTSSKVHRDLTALYRQQQPLSFLYHGVTQILDPGAGTELFSNQPVHPDLFRCGGIPNLGGYPELPALDAIEAYPYFVIDGSYKGPFPSGTNSDDHTPEAVVAQMAANGEICVKLYLEDGFGAASHWPLLKGETFKRIQAAADEHGLPTVAHANAIDMYQIALDTGINVFGHGLWNWQWNEEKNGPSPLQSVLEQVQIDERGYMPTIRVMAGLQEVLLEDTLTNPEFAYATPKELLNWYKTDEANWFQKELVADFGPQATRERAAEMLGYGVQRAQRAAAVLSQASHPILLASDFPGSPSYANQPGLTTLQEMRMLADAGVSLAAIFQAGTINNAQQFGLDDRYGSIEVGKIANLLLLNANPLETVEAWNKIDTVILHGKAIARRSLRADR